MLLKVLVFKKFFFKKNANCTPLDLCVLYFYIVLFYLLIVYSTCHTLF